MLDNASELIRCEKRGKEIAAFHLKALKEELTYS